MMRHKKLLSPMLGLLFVLLIIYYIAINWEAFASLSIASPWYLFLITVVLLFNFYANGALMDSSLKPHNLSLDRVETMGLSAITRLGNYLAFGYLGIAIRALYFKTKHKLNYSDFVSSFSASLAFLYITSAFVGLIGFLVIGSSSTNFTDRYKILVLTLLSVFFGLLIILLLPIKSPGGKGFYSRSLKNLIEGWHLIRKSRGSVLLCIGWSTLVLVSFIIMLCFEFRVFGYDISIAEAAVITSVSSLNALIAITPAGIGINEGLVIIAASAIGVPTEVALSATLLRRIIVFVTSLLLSFYFSKKIFGKNLTQLFHLSK